MNKTFLLVAKASYTEGAMLIVIDSIDEYISLFKEYHHNKMLALDEFEVNLRSSSRGNRNRCLNDLQKARDNFIIKHNYKPYDFEVSTGTKYIEEGKGAGNFLNGIIISDDPNKSECWYIEKEFLSDLPKGTHYCGDYCA